MTTLASVLIEMKFDGFFFYYVLGGIWIVPLNNQYMVQRSVEIKKKHAPVFIQLWMARQRFPFSECGVIWDFYLHILNIQQKNLEEIFKCFVILFQVKSGWKEL